MTSSRSPRVLLAALLASLVALSCDVDVARIASAAPPEEEPAGPRQGTVTIEREEAPPPQRQAPGPGDGQPAPAGDLVTWLNVVRADAQLLPIRHDGALADAATAHAVFLLAHHDLYESQGLSAHVEPPDLAGFTGESFVDRADHFSYEGKPLAEVVAFKAASVAAGRSWMESLYHRLPLLSPRSEEVGYGGAHEGARAVNVLELGRESEAPAVERRVVYPLPEAVDVPMAWDGAEVPQPLPPPAGYPSGPVVTVQATRAGLGDVVAGIVGPDGEALPAHLLTADNDEHLPATVVALIPHEPLAPEAVYTVTVTGTHGGEPFSETWSFTTRAAGCDLVGQDCGAGQGCYLVDGAPRCLWAGTAMSDAPCEHLNTCAAGLTCLGSRCQAFCDAAGGATADDACATRCPDGDILLEEGRSARVCLGASCATDAGLCGAGEGCYWVGAFLCDEAGTVPAGGVCQFANDCAPGHGCLGWNGEFRCRALCGGDGMPTCAARCANESMSLDAASGVRFCP